jgi:DNA-binding NtrC family response regulator
MKRHILLVDGDISEWRLFGCVINNLGGGFTCSYVSTAEEAAVVLMADKFDFVFTGYNLPGISGLHLLSYIKNKRRLKKIPVFIYSAEINDNVAEMARLLQAAGCIQKGGTFNWLTHQLKAIIAGDLLPDWCRLQHRADLCNSTIPGNRDYPVNMPDRPSAVFETRQVEAQ